MFSNEAIEKICEQPLTHEKSAINKFILDLKDADASLILTMRILIEKLGIGLNEACDLTLDSPAWIEHKQSFHEFNRQFLDTLEKYDESVEQ